MRVAEIMNTQALVVNPDDTIGSGAHQMAEKDVGFLPVVKAGRLVGVITDREIEPEEFRCPAEGITTSQSEDSPFRYAGTNAAR